MAVTTLFMVIFVRRGIKINKTGGNPVLYIDKKVFAQKMTIFSVCFFLQFLNFWTPHSPQKAQNLFLLLSLSSLGKTGSKWYVTCHVNSKYLQIYSVWKDFVQIWLRATHFRGFYKSSQWILCLKSALRRDRTELSNVINPIGIHFSWSKLHRNKHLWEILPSYQRGSNPHPGDR